jgi:hypothetical protein
MNRPIDDDDTDVDAIEFSSAVGKNMKGVIIDGEVFAWDVDPESGMPEHDTITDNRFSQSADAQMTYMGLDGVPYCNVSYYGNPFGDVARHAIGAFTDVRRGTELRIDSDHGSLTMPFEDYVSYYRLAPDPEDFDDGEEDSEFIEELNELISLINSQKTVRQLLGRGGEDDVYEGFSVYGNPRRKP